MMDYSYIHSYLVSPYLCIHPVPQTTKWYFSMRPKNQPRVFSPNLPENMGVSTSNQPEEFSSNPMPAGMEYTEHARLLFEVGRHPPEPTRA